MVDPTLPILTATRLTSAFAEASRTVLRFDAGLYYLYYADRVGTITLKDSAGNNYNYRTNTGTTEAKGWKCSLNFILLTGWALLPLATSVFFFHFHRSRRLYKRKCGGKRREHRHQRNKLENAPDPDQPFRNHLELQESFLTGQYSYTSSIYSDASNAESSKMP
jgi:Fe(3+) dicitrate transport protein